MLKSVTFCEQNLFGSRTIGPSQQTLSGKQQMLRVSPYVSHSDVKVTHHLTIIRPNVMHDIHSLDWRQQTIVAKQELPLPPSTIIIPVPVMANHSIANIVENFS